MNNKGFLSSNMTIDNKFNKLIGTITNIYYNKFVD